MTVYQEGGANILTMRPNKIRDRWHEFLQNFEYLLICLSRQSSRLHGAQCPLHLLPQRLRLSSVCSLSFSSRYEMWQNVFYVTVNAASVTIWHFYLNSFDYVDWFSLIPVCENHTIVWQCKHLGSSRPLSRKQNHDTGSDAFYAGGQQQFKKN